MESSDKQAETACCQYFVYVMLRELFFRVTGKPGNRLKKHCHTEEHPQTHYCANSNIRN
jgi:hypothetical protein